MAKQYSYKTVSGKVFKDANPNLTCYLYISGIGYSYYETYAAANRVKDSYCPKRYRCSVGDLERLD